MQIHGAEVDLIAKRKDDPFAANLYIEATIEHVDNDKYGKDVGKFALIHTIEPQANCLIVSSTGFSLPVQERASKSRIQTLTYEQLFSKFQRFDPYVQHALGDTSLGRDLKSLSDTYEEPDFDDSFGSEPATKFLDTWRDSADTNRWLIVVGEYGTGKTALTKTLQYRWLRKFKNEPKLPIPFRIELRDFSRQFDANGLLHHFLDKNHLGHLPIEFVTALIRAGRIVLILDGYDEMAQYMHARERRACLETLAELSSGGAKGILTSRPNYFSEVEEYQVFEILYSSINEGSYRLRRGLSEAVDREKKIDELIESHFLQRHERQLKDLTPAQTEALISRKLAADADLRNADFSRATLDAVSLSGANLEGASFAHALCFGVDLTGALLKEANFKGLDATSSIIVARDEASEDGLKTELEGNEALGFLSYAGAITDAVPRYFILRNQPDFPIVEKICRKCSEGLRQRRGLEQRGAARANPDFARKFVHYAESRSLLETPKGRPDLIEATPLGREVFKKFVELKEVGPEIGDFFV